MATPVSLAEALALLTPTLSDKISGQDIRDTVSWLSQGRIETEAYAPLLTINRHKLTVATANAAGVVVVALASSGHVAGPAQLILVPAGTVSAANDLIIASDLDPSESFDPFNPTSDYLLIVQCVDGAGAGKFVAAGRDLSTRTTTVPSILGATVDVGVDADKMIVEFSVPMLAESMVGITTPFSSGTPRSITAVSSVNGDGTEWTYDLDGDVAGTDAFNLVVGSDRQWQTLNGVLLGTGSTAVSVLGGDYDWGAVSNLSVWLRADSGIGVADGATLSSGWTGRNPPAAYAFSEATNRPTYRATGVNGHPGVDFDGVNDRLTSAAMTVTDMVGASSTAFFIAAALKLDAVDSTGGPSYDNDAVFSDPTGWIGLHLTNHAGVYKVIGYVYSGGTVYVEYALGGVLPSTLVAHLRLSGGNLYVGVNGTESSGVTCGAVASAANALNVQLGKAATAKFLDGQIAEFVAVKSGTFPSAGVAAMTSKYT